MKCAVALDRMLETDPRELRGETGSDLSRHIDACDHCAAVAGALQAELDRLDQGLEAWARSGDADTAVDAVLADEPARHRSRKAAGTRRGPRGRTSPWIRRPWIPLAAAAVIAGLLVLTPSEPDWSTGSIQPPREPAVTVQPPSDRGAVVMETANPKITIVWLYEREET